MPPPSLFRLAKKPSPNRARPDTVSAQCRQLQSTTKLSGKVNIFLSHGIGTTLKVEARFWRYPRRNWPIDTKRYKHPVNLKQRLNNTFILVMCHAKFTRLNTQRELENWARKDIEKRLRILLHIHQNDEELPKESLYYKQGNLLWKLES